VDSKLKWIHAAQSTPFAGLLEMKAYTNALAFGEPTMASILWLGNAHESLMVHGVTLHLDDIRKVILNHTNVAESALKEELLLGFDPSSLDLPYVSLRDVPGNKHLGYSFIAEETNALEKHEWAVMRHILEDPKLRSEFFRHVPVKSDVFPLNATMSDISF
jgi:hypothetical protein